MKRLPAVIGAVVVGEARGSRNGGSNTAVADNVVGSLQGSPPACSGCRP